MEELIETIERIDKNKNDSFALFINDVLFSDWYHLEATDDCLLVETDNKTVICGILLDKINHIRLVLNQYDEIKWKRK